MIAKQPEALRLAHTFDHPLPPEWSDMKAAAAELRRLHHHTEVLRAERDRARSCYDATVKLLTGIHMLLYPAPTTMPDGRVMVFRPKSLDPHEVLQELSDRIRALPDELEKVTTIQQAEAKTDESVASIYITASGEREFDDWKCDLPVGRNILYTHPAPGVPDDVARDAERYRWLRSLEHCNEAWCLIGSGNANSNLDAAIDAAMLTAAQAQKGGECLPIRGNQVTCSRGTGGCGIQHKGGD